MKFQLIKEKYLSLDVETMWMSLKDLRNFIMALCHWVKTLSLQLGKKKISEEHNEQFYPGSSVSIGTFLV